MKVSLLRKFAKKNVKLRLKEKLTLKMLKELGVVVHAYNPSTLETGERRSQVQGQPGICSKIETSVDTQQDPVSKKCTKDSD
jgi:hypothetical protein